MRAPTSPSFLQCRRRAVDAASCFPRDPKSQDDRRRRGAANGGGSAEMSFAAPPSTFRPRRCAAPRRSRPYSINPNSLFKHIARTLQRPALTHSLTTLRYEIRLTTLSHTYKHSFSDRPNLQISTWPALCSMLGPVAVAVAAKALDHDHHESMTMTIEQAQAQAMPRAIVV